MYRLRMNGSFIDGFVTLATAQKIISDTTNHTDNIRFKLIRNDTIIFRRLLIDASIMQWEWQVNLHPRVERIDWIVWYREHEHYTYAYIAAILGITRQSVRQAYLKYVEKTDRLIRLGA